MSIAVVPMTASHPAFGQVADLFDAYRGHYGQQPAPEAARDWLREQLTQRRLRVVGAFEADQLRGFITVAVAPASLMLGTAWGIRDLYVPPEHRRGGIARALLRYVIDEARDAGATRLSLQTETDNARALNLYRSAGFEPVTGLETLSLALR